MARKASRANQITRVLEEVRTGADGDLSFREILSLAQVMSRSLSSVYRAIDKSVYKEFTEIASYIEAMKSDIAGLQANDLKQLHLPTAGRELDAVVTATEEATNTIMECAEAIMNADGSDPAAYQDFVNEQVMKIFEACSFQDITGQRISKVVETLNMIDERVSRFAQKMRVEDSEGPLTDEEAARAERKKRLMLDGPSAPGEGINQDEVDSLFS